MAGFGLGALHALYTRRIDEHGRSRRRCRPQRRTGGDWLERDDQADVGENPLTDGLALRNCG
jgi:hypothetical protein